MRKLFFSLLLLTLLFSCSKTGSFSKIPKLTFNSMSVNKIKAASDTTFFVYINFEDGDGDIGGGTNNLYFIDNRDTDTVAYPIPSIPERFEPKRGLKGSLQIEILAALINLRTDTTHMESDTLTWNIYLKDLGGNMSNVITSTPLILTK